MVTRAIGSCSHSYGDLLHIFEGIEPYNRLARLRLRTVRRLLILAPEQARFYFAYPSLLDRAEGISHRPEILTCFDRESGFLGRLIRAATLLEQFDVDGAWRTVGGSPEGVRVLDEDWRIADRLVQPDFTMVDIGANQGLTALVYRRFAVEVHAFEPNPDSAPLVEPMRAIGVEFGLAGAAGRLSLFQTTGNSGSATFYPPQSAGHRQLHHTDARRIDDLDLPPADFLSIDAEAAELKILKGARHRLETQRPGLSRSSCGGTCFSTSSIFWPLTAVTA